MPESDRILVWGSNPRQAIVTFAVFLNSVYIPVVHILLTDKTAVSYEQAFRQFKSIANCDTENQIEWEKKQFISDFENSLGKAIDAVFTPLVHNKCYFHYVKALYDNFYDKVPEYLHSTAKEVIDVIKLKPFFISISNFIAADWMH